MKKLILILALISGQFVYSQTATNFTCNDCSGTSHDLFSELDNGNVVVLCWVMPCGSCVSGALTCSNITATYPSNVKYYVADDLGNTSCTSVSSWLGSNGVSPDAVFSNSSINMMDYGSSGMPKIVVIGGSNHTVFYNANNSFNPQDIQNAIDQALLVASVKETGNAFGELKAFPNPSSDFVRLQYSSEVSASVCIDVFNLEGKKVLSFTDEAIVGENRFEFKHELPSSTYMVRVSDGHNSRLMNLVVLN